MNELHSVHMLSAKGKHQECDQRMCRGANFTDENADKDERYLHEVCVIQVAVFVEVATNLPPV